jgi:hypothetical protein
VTLPAPDITLSSGITSPCAGDGRVSLYVDGVGARAARRCRNRGAARHRPIRCRRHGFVGELDEHKSRTRRARPAG